MLYGIRGDFQTSFERVFKLKNHLIYSPNKYYEINEKQKNKYEVENEDLWRQEKGAPGTVYIKDTLPYQMKKKLLKTNNKTMWYYRKILIPR